jgi:SAM-dependent methyltransferase
LAIEQGYGFLYRLIASRGYTGTGERRGGRELQARAHERRWKQYELEKELAARILASVPENRLEVTSQCYDLLTRSLGDFEGSVETPRQRSRRLRILRSLYEPLVSRASNVLELGCGDGALSTFLARTYPGIQITGTDVSTESIADAAAQVPSNLRFLSMPAYPAPLRDGSFDLVLSSQMVEHLHPGDVPVHLREVHRLLRPHGIYAFDTPNRITGPHDVSQFFGEPVARGLHLREWTFEEMRDLLREAGFGQCTSDIPIWGVLHQRGLAPGSHPTVPVQTKIWTERAVGQVKSRRARALAGQLLRVSNMVFYARKTV